MEPGTRLGPYEIVEQLGAGGMGEVYLAQDSRLGRKVAIKVLPVEFAADPERLARFELEARAAAALSHPHIAAIHDVGTEDGIHFMVQEHLEGETLREPLDRGSLPLKRGLALAAEIAEALAAAHAAGIVHRDLKPENVFVTREGHAKVLDFGLAKLTEVALSGAAGDSTRSPTMMGTVVGQIMGTAGYMAPEQVEGGEVDARTDLFAFGALLYEMVTGRQAFVGESVHDTLHRIGHTEPQSLGEIDSDLPSQLLWIIRKSLAKEPGARYQHADDLVVDLRALGADVEAGTAPTIKGASPATAPEAPATGFAIPTRREFPALLLAVIATAAATWWLAGLGPAPEPEPVRRFDIELAPDTQFTRNRAGNVVSISPDGTTVAFVADGRLWIRPIDSREARPLGNTDGAGIPFFSPDGQEIGFDAGDQMKRIAVTGGAAVVVGAAAERIYGASWAEDGFIYVGYGTEGIVRLPATGGVPEVVIEGEERWAHGPQLLPGGEWLLFTLASGPRAWDDAQIVVESLASRERRVLVDGGREARITRTGHLLYVHQGVLYARRLDMGRMETGGPVPMIEGIRTVTANVTGAANYRLSERGDLVYVPGEAGGQADATVVWVDRTGREEPLPFEPAGFGTLRLSPDGSRIAVEVRDEGDSQIWLYSVDRPGGQRMTSGGDSFDPVWSPDGDWVYFASDRGGDPDIWRQRADLSGEAEQVYAKPGLQYPWSISADGTRLLFGDNAAGSDIAMLSLQGDPEPEMLVQTPSNEFWPRFSPDGRFFTYVSTETGTTEIYVMEVESRRRWLISTAGGNYPIWTPDGRETTFWSGNDRVAVAVSTEPEFTAAPPERLYARENYRTDSDVTADGQRFLQLKGIEANEPTAGIPRIFVVLNWFEELKQRVPTGR